MKKSLLVATILVLVVLVAGCSAGKATSTTTGSSEVTSTAPGDTSGTGAETSTTGTDSSTSGTDSSTTLTTTSSTSGDSSTTAPESTTLSTTSTTAAASSSTADAQAINHQQTDSRLVFAGSWQTASNASASGGSLVYSNSSGASLTIRFIGTHLYWIAKKSPQYGKAKVMVDGASVGTVDLYSASTVWQHMVWATGTLSSGAHTVKIQWTGQKSAAAKGTYIDVDAIKVDGVVTGHHEQGAAKLVYTGTWKTTSSASASGGSIAFADSSGASVTIHFNGIDLAWIAKKSPAYGKAKVTVDGGSPVAVDLYSASVLWKQRVWSTGILKSGAHTVKISWTGSKHTGATGANIDIDAVDVTGTL
jgi:hypothetical protein